MGEPDKRILHFDTDGYLVGRAEADPDAKQWVFVPKVKIVREFQFASPEMGIRFGIEFGEQESE